MRPAQSLLVAALLLWGAPSAAPAQPASGSAPPTIEQGSTVQLEYTLKDEAGTVLDTNKGAAPLTYTHGERQIIPGLEKQLAGLHTGDEKKIVLKPEDGYGTVDPSAHTEVDKNLLPKEALTVGSRLMARTATGEERPVTVKEVKDKTVVLDLNHPLAGKTLVFDIRVLGVAPPKPADAGAKPAEPKAAPSTPAEPKPAEPKPAEPKSSN
jgi:FKBP-type peptidyl-prolyl cis-trans isomerase SlyD